MDITTASAAMSSLKAAADIAQAMIGLNTAQAVNAKVLEIQSRLMEAQHAVFAVNQERATLVQRVADLEETIMRSKNWDVEKQRYEPHELALGVIAYALKPGEETAEPFHYICPNCYQDAHKSFLQGQTREGHAGAETKSCNRCGLVLRYVRRDLPPKPQRPIRPLYPA